MSYRPDMDAFRQDCWTCAGKAAKAYNDAHPGDMWLSFDAYLCPECGNKRCAKANDCEKKCDMKRNKMDPKYYEFPNGVTVRHISSHLTGNGAQALQYVARSCRLDGNNKGDSVEDIRKAIDFLNWEIERLEGEQRE